MSEVLRAEASEANERASVINVSAVLTGGPRAVKPQQAAAFAVEDEDEACRRMSGHVRDLFSNLDSFAFPFRKSLFRFLPVRLT